jgi:hypothetical protein
MTSLDWIQAAGKSQVYTLLYVVKFAPAVVVDRCD